MSKEEETTASTWDGMTSLLRLFHVIIDENIINEYLETQYIIQDEDSFDSQLDLWSRVTALYNDPDFQPKSYFLPSLHRDFNGEMKLSRPVELQKMRELFIRFTVCKKQLKSLRTYIFDDTRYENKKVKPTIISLIHLSSREEKLSTLYAFPSTLLYLWHLDDVHHWFTPLEAEQSDFGSIESSYVSSFQNRRRPQPGLMEGQMDAIESKWSKLQSAERHHSEMVKTYAEMLSKVNTIGGKNHDKMALMIGDISLRIQACYDRCIGIETAIVAEQGN